MAKTLLSQITPSEIRAVGLLVGIDEPGPTFHVYLHEMPPLPGAFTLGDVARAYLAARLEAMSK